jgi:hypothetical protein
MFCPKCKEKMAIVDTISRYQDTSYDRRLRLQVWADRLLGPYRDHQWTARRHRCKDCDFNERTVTLPGNILAEIIKAGTIPEVEDKPVIYQVRPYLK